MAYQTNRNLFVASKLEATFGTLPGASGADIFRANSGAVSLSKEPIRSGENRRDGMTTRGRHGSRSVAGSYVGDLSVGTFDKWIEAVLRGTFDTPLALTALSVAADSAAKTFTRSAGSWITDGVRIGDVVRFGAFTAGGAPNNSRNFTVVALTATVLTVAETPATIAQQTAITLARSKKVIQGTTRRSFTIEEHELDIDGSEVFTGCRIGSMQLQMQPNGMATLTFGIVGQDMQVMTGAQAPYFTAPVATVTLGLTAVEALIRLGSTPVLDITGIDLTVNLNAAGQPVVGSNITPDVFDNLATIEGSITALRQDVSRVQNFLNEDQLSLSLVFAENTAQPAPFCAFSLCNFTFSSATKSELGSDGPRTQTLNLLVGKDERGGAYDPTMISFQSSAA